MKLSVNWLKDYVAVGIPADKLAHRLTMAGMEVEKIEDVDGDKVFELEITPNRPDCLNMIGLARETAAVIGKVVKRPRIKKITMPREKCDVAIRDGKDCRRYIGTVIANVRVGPSPDWMQKRLKAVGLRPINNVVDITNFCLLETGQPMHAFDYDKLSGNKIIVRRADPGEKILTLDGNEHALAESVLVIADARRPVAVAGIMGGADTQVTETTKNIFLESAYFDPVLIRRAARLLGLSSDSSYRFERGVDMATVAGGSLRAVSLILEIAGGKIKAHKDLFPARKTARGKRITVDLDSLRAFLGASAPSARVKKILRQLGFKVLSGSGRSVVVEPPSFRSDVTQPVDIVEEVGRIVGYDNLPMTLPIVKYIQIPDDETRIFKSRVRDILSGAGLNEVISYTLCSRDNLQKTRTPPEQGVAVLNPLTQDQAVLCPSLLPGLLADVRLNLNRQEKHLQFFEIGKRYSASGENDVLGLMMTGLGRRDWRTREAVFVDYFDMKGVVTHLLECLHFSGLQFEPDTAPVFFSGENSVIRHAGQVIGRAGRVHPDILKEWDIKEQSIYYAEIDLKILRELVPPARLYQPVSDYPAVVRDVSLAVKKDVSYQMINDVVHELGGGLLKEISFIEQYSGDKIPPGTRGLVFSLIYRSPQRTLTEGEVNQVHGAILGALVNRLNATIR